MSDSPLGTLQSRLERSWLGRRRTPWIVLATAITVAIAGWLLAGIASSRMSPARDPGVGMAILSVAALVWLLGAAAVLGVSELAGRRATPWRSVLAVLLGLPSLILLVTGLTLMGS